MSVKNQQLFRSTLQMKQVTQFQTHLGVPVNIVGKKSLNFNFLIDKVVDLLVSWNVIQLSHSDNHILINSIVIGMMSHIVYCLEIPLSIANEIDSM